MQISTNVRVNSCRSRTRSQRLEECDKASVKAKVTTCLKFTLIKKSFVHTWEGKVCSTYKLGAQTDGDRNVRPHRMIEVASVSRNLLT